MTRHARGRPTQTWVTKTLEMAKDPRYKGKPLSIAVVLGRNYKDIVQVLEERSLVAEGEYPKFDVGLADYDF